MFLFFLECNCNGHSERCHFDLNHYIATGQVSGGVCEDCRNNRIGAQCEQCQPGYYRDPQHSVEDPAACIRECVYKKQQTSHKLLVRVSHGLNFLIMNFTVVLQRAPVTQQGLWMVACVIQ